VIAKERNPWDYYYGLFTSAYLNAAESLVYVWYLDSMVQHGNDQIVDGVSPDSTESLDTSGHDITTVRASVYSSTAFWVGQ